MARLVHVKTNAAATRSGDWVGDLPELDGFRVKLKPLDSNAAMAAASQLYEQVLGRKGARKLNRMPPELVAYVHARTLIDVCVADWEGLAVPVDAAGKPALDGGAVDEKELPFSRELIEAILLEPAEGGKIVTDPAPGEAERKFKTPDGRQARESMRGFLNALVLAAGRVNEPDDEEEDEDGEKNASAPSSQDSGNGATTPGA